MIANFVFIFNLKGKTFQFFEFVKKSTVKLVGSTISACRFQKLTNRWRNSECFFAFECFACTIWSRPKKRQPNDVDDDDETNANGEQNTYSAFITWNVRGMSPHLTRFEFRFFWFHVHCSRFWIRRTIEKKADWIKICKLKKRVCVKHSLEWKSAA